MIYDPVKIALDKLRPGASWTITDGHLGIQWDEDDKPINVIWNDRSPIPTREELEPEVQLAMLEHANNEYQRKRQPEYPPLADFVDAMYWQTKGDNTKMTAYLAAVDTVKAKYPKE